VDCARAVAALKASTARAHSARVTRIVPNPFRSFFMLKSVFKIHARATRAAGRWKKIFIAGR
jgi:hypothetical protein